MLYTEDYVKVEIGGRDLFIYRPKVAFQTNGAAVVKYEDTVVMSVVVMGKERDVDFLPLTVEYEEKMYAAGKIPGSFFRREGRASDKSILTSRVIDRSIRPLFPEGFRREIQVVSIPLSTDQGTDPDVLCTIATVAALLISDVPFESYLGTVRVGLEGDRWVINPTFTDEESFGELNIVISALEDRVVMVEGIANEIPEEKFLEAIKVGHGEIKKIIEKLKEFRGKFGKEKIEFEPKTVPEDVLSLVWERTKDGIENVLNILEKLKRDEAIKNLKEESYAAYVEEVGEDAEDLIDEVTWYAAIEKLLKKRMRERILNEGKRVDGRTPDDIRELEVEVGMLPRVHGSGLFRRGLTQVLSITTLGAVTDQQKIEGLGELFFKRYMHQYNFPGFSVGEVRSIYRMPSRREIGHGALAEKALVPVLPSKDDFPYTIRVVSEVLSSNGSTSMASVCGSSLSLMDAGVPIKAMVAGVAMGLVTDGYDRFAVLMDLQGMEDFYGDMDFKVAGTEKGITAVQVDVKIPGLTYEIIEETLRKARIGRLKIMQKMKEAISEPRETISKYAPQIISMPIKRDKIGELIGPGGKNIRKIMEETKSEIFIDDEKGIVYITSPDGESAERAVDLVRESTEDVEVGKVYEVEVRRVLDRGAIVGFLKFPRQTAFLHISEIDDRRIDDIHKELREGQRLTVKVIRIDETENKVFVSLKALKK